MKGIFTWLLLCFCLFPLAGQSQSSVTSVLQKSKPAVTRPRQMTKALSDSLQAAALETQKYIAAKKAHVDALAGHGIYVPLGEEVSMAKTLPEARKDVWKAASPGMRYKVAGTPRRKTAGKIVLGNYASRDSSHYEGLLGSYMKLIQDSTGQYCMTGVYSWDDTLKVNFDAAAGTVTIPPQVLTTSGTQKIYFYAADWTKNIYYPDANVTGTVDASGIINIGSWGIFRPNNDGTASIYNGFSRSTWRPTEDNTSYVTLKSNGKEGNSVSYATTVEQTGPREVVIMNFANNGKSVYGRITSDKRVIVSPQLIMTNLFYGKFLCFKLDSTGKKIAPNDNIIGVYSDDGTISFGNWAVADQSSHTRVALRTTRYTVHTDAVIKWPEAVVANFEGEGTKASPYLIKTYSDLEALAESVESGNTYQGKYLKLNADIDLSAVQGYLPIGNYTNQFLGTFDGGGKTLSGLNIVNRGGNYYGLFGSLGEGSAVKDITIKNFTIKGSGSYAGTLAGESYASIDGVKVSGTTLTITGAYVGGLTGMSYGSVNNSYYEGNISAYGSVGGLCGYSYGPVKNCHVTGIVRMPGTVNASANNDIGGLVAIASRRAGNDSTWTNNYFSGAILDETGYSSAGGLTAFAYDIAVSKCFNTGMISTSRLNGTDDRATGGLCGNILHSTFTDCYNAGTILKSGTSDKVGGLAGNLSMMMSSVDGPINLSHFTNCYNSGSLYYSPSVENNHAGVWGAETVMDGYHPGEHFLTNCYNDKVSTALKDSLFGKTTSELTDGTLPEGFSSETWQAQKNCYPVLKALASTTASKVSAANIMFKNEETPNKFKHTAGIHYDSSLKARILDSEKGYVTEDDNMKVSADSIYVKSNYATEMFTIGTTDNLQMRVYRLAIVPQVFEGEGTKASPYLIRNKEDFKKLNEAVYVYAQPHEGDYFLMTNDIDFERANDFHGVGYGENARTTLREFDGDFNGGGHRIKGLYVKSYAFDAQGKTVTDSLYNYGALFRILGKYGSIHDLVIDKDNDFYIYSHGGAVAGYVMGKLYNVKNYANIYGYDDFIGGLTGTVGEYGQVSNCYNAGKVYYSSNNGGGIAGNNLGLIEKSQNDGDVTGSKYEYGTQISVHRAAGGIAGINQGIINDCVNTATVTASTRTGGIAGYSYLGTANRNLSTGIVIQTTNETSEGGLVGEESTTGCIYSGNVYDASINIKGSVMGARKDGCTGVSTASLVSGTLPEGLTDSLFATEAGSYPVLKAFANEEATKALRKMYAKFADNTERTDIQKPVELSQADGLQWALTTGKNYTIANSTLSLTSISDDDVASDTLTATLGSAYKKVLYIASIPKILPGQGTKDAPFEIKTKDDLNKVADFIDKTGTTFKGYYFKVMNDIDYASDSLHVFSMGSNAFNGDFDGNGKTISGYQYSNTTSKLGRYVGFFGSIGVDGYVHDLTLNGKININSYGGGFVGKLYGKLYNVVNKGTITASSSTAYVAGIAGDVLAGSVIDHAKNEANMKFTGTYCAGIAARMYEGSTVKNCVNEGELSTSKATMAGITAYMMTGGSVDSCSNSAKLTSTSSSVAGIVASVAAHPYSITNCSNTGDLTASSSVAGIVTTITAKAEGLLKNCFNTASITGKSSVAGVACEIGAGTTISYCYNTGSVTATNGGYAGGVIAKLNAGFGTTATTYHTAADHLYNTGDVSSTKGSTGGVFGDISGDDGVPHITDSYNLGTVLSSYTSSSVTDVAGFAGSTDGIIERCWNAGDVSCEGFGAAGFASIGGPVVTDCFNVGNVEANATKKTSKSLGTAGGMWGYGRAVLNSCYNMGNVTGPSMVGGIEGAAFSESGFTNCYNAGLVTATTDDSKASNLTWISDIEDLDTIANNFFDMSVNKEFEIDSRIGMKGLTTAQLYNATALGDHYAYNRAAYPVLKSIEEKAVMNFFAADTLFAEGDDASHVTKPFYVGNLDSVSWTSSPNITIADGVASGTVGKGWVKKTTTFKGMTYEKTYEVNITMTTGINAIETADNGELDKTKPMYNVSGQRVNSDYRGVVIQKGKKFILK